MSKVYFKNRILYFHCSAHPARGRVKSRREGRKEGEIDLLERSDTRAQFAELPERACSMDFNSIGESILCKR